MLRFISIEKDLRRGGPETLSVTREAIHPSLESARNDPRGRSILVYDAASIPETGSDRIKLNISDARNGEPYLSPVDVTAGGGYVVRAALTGKEVLLIFRRGVWDLPKGKVDEGESIESAAVREVREEVGAEDLRIVATLGTTVHGYPDGTRYAVKTTHWFLMETDSRQFEPQRSEGIEQVRWTAWDRASEMLGFETLRDHIATISVQELVRNP